MSRGQPPTLQTVITNKVDFKIKSEMLEENQQESVNEETISKLEGYLCVHDLLKRRVLTKTNSDFLSFVRYVAPDLVHDWRMGRHIKII